MFTEINFLWGIWRHSCWNQRQINYLTPKIVFMITKSIKIYEANTFCFGGHKRFWTKSTHKMHIYVALCLLRIICYEYASVQYQLYINHPMFSFLDKRPSNWSVHIFLYIINAYVKNLLYPLLLISLDEVILYEVKP